MVMLGDNSPAGERSAWPKTGVFGARELSSDAGSAGEDLPVVDVAAYWRLALKFRFLIIGCFLGALVIGATLTLLTTPIYTAKATIQIDREAARVLATEDVAPRENMMMGEEFFQTQYGLLRSRSLAERVIESLGLASSNQALKGMGIEAPEAEGTAAEQAAARRAAAL